MLIKFRKQALGQPFYKAASGSLRSLRGTSPLNTLEEPINQQLRTENEEN